jgi:hypothetical protein
MAETDFLSFLVDETLKLQKSGEVELSSLELKLNDYKLAFLKGEYIPQTQMLRFSTTFGVLDIPINWSVFSVDAQDSADQVITSRNDSDYLLEIFKRSWNSSVEQLLVTHADGFCYIVGLRQGEEYCLHDLLNPQELLKAA